MKRGTLVYREGEMGSNKREDWDSPKGEKLVLFAFGEQEKGLS